MRVHGRVRAVLEVSCDRCLRGVPYAVEDEFDVTYAPALAESDAEKHELQIDDLELDVYEDDFIETGGLAREQVLLNLPLRLLCEEDCQGLCPNCGTDLNAEQCGCEQKTIDPRWEGLKEIMN